MSINHIKVNELDPAQIKANLKEYFSKEESPYKDWNFESSGLDLQLAVLAYNTHMNAMLASTAFNEAFIESAQLRKNLVSNARTLGYVPRSRRASFIDVQLKFYYDPESTSTDNDINEPILSKNTVFISETDDSKELKFITAKDVVGIKGTGTADFPKDSNEFVRLYQGNFKSESFVSDASIANQAFKLSSSTIDTNTITVRVNSEDYAQSKSLADLSPDSAVYFIDESSTGKYDIYFGNGVLGKKVPNLASIVVSYIETDGEDGNDLTAFEFASTVDTQLNNSGALLKVPPLIVLQENAKSAGGAERESMDSIRFNAPKSFITQNRAVTVQDYENVILKEFGSNISSAVAWGSDVDAQSELDLAEYAKTVGVAYISLIDSNKDPVLLESELELLIRATIEEKRVFTVKTEFKLAARTDIVPVVVYRYDPIQFNGSLSDLTIALRSTINEFSASSLEKFKTTFNLSRFYAALDATDVNVKSTYVKSLKLRKYLDIVNSAPIDDVVHLMPECTCDLETFDLAGADLTAYRNTPDYTHNLITSNSWVSPAVNGEAETDRTWTIRDHYDGVANERDLYLYKVNYDNDGAITSYNRYGSLGTDSLGRINRLSDDSIELTLYGSDDTGLSASVIQRLRSETDVELKLDLQIENADVKYTQNSFGLILGEETTITSKKID